MNQQDLDKLKALCEAATEAPWLNASVNVETEDSQGVAASWGDEDAEFVCAARTAIPQLIARIGQLEASLEKLVAREVLLSAAVEAARNLYALVDYMSYVPLDKALAALEEKE